MIYNLAHNYQWSSVGLGGGIIGFAVVAGIWDLVWKGLGLWRAAQRQESGWFVAMLLLNTLGILPILYLYVFSKPTSASSHKTDK